MTTDECCRGACAKRLRDGLGARRSERGYNAFTLIELIVVVGVIIILTGLVLSTVGYARKKGARARAETEIAAMSAACESYKAINGIILGILRTTQLTTLLHLLLAQRRIQDRHLMIPTIQDIQRRVFTFTLSSLAIPAVIGQRTPSEPISNSSRICSCRLAAPA